jgi:uncharacterized SAM-binding protein YcdF (DUF218 family)
MSDDAAIVEAMVARIRAIMEKEAKVQRTRDTSRGTGGKIKASRRMLPAFKINNSIIVQAPYYVGLDKVRRGWKPKNPRSSAEV